MSDGLVSVSTESTGAAVAQAEAYDLELLGGVVSASIVSRTATGTTKGTRYRGTVLDLVVGEREIGEVKGTKTLRRSTPARSWSTRAAKACGSS